MNENVVTYSVESINEALGMLNNLNVTGVNNANMIVRIASILQNPIQADNNVGEAPAPVYEPDVTEQSDND